MQKRDFKYMGIPNICFSITKPDDDREKKFKKQRLTRGFDNSETWQLDQTIASFILPRLKAYKDIAYGTIEKTPNNKKFFKNIDKAIIAFEIVIEGKWAEGDSEKYWKGINAFKNIFTSLWW